MEKHKNIIMASLLLGLNGLDWVNLGDIFRHGKIRFCLLALVPVSFVFFSKRLHWSAGLIGATVLGSWVIHDYQALGMISLILIFACLSLASAIVQLPKELFAKVLIISGLIETVICLLQRVGIHFLFHPAYQRDMHEMVGTYGNRTILGPFLVACLAPALWERKWWAVIPMTLAIALLHSTLTFAAFAAVFLLYVWHACGPLRAIVFGWVGFLAIALAVFHYPKFSGFDFDGRLQMWSAGISAVKQAPWFGAGIGAWQQIYLPQYGAGLLKVFGDTVPRQLHCDALDFAVEYGLVPLAILGIALAQFVRNLKPTWHHAVCAGLLINSLGNFPFAIISIALIFTVCWAHSMKQGGMDAA